MSEQQLSMQLQIKEPMLPIERIKAKERLKQLKKYEPSWKEVLYEGYQDGSKNGKKGIFQLQNSDSDAKRIQEVVEAIQAGELDTGVDSLRKFTRSHVLRQYKKLQLLRRQQKIEQLIKNKPSNYHTIQSLDQLDQLVVDLQKEPIFAIDTETTGLDIFRDEIVGISITLPLADYHVYIPVAHVSGQQLDRQVVLTTLQPILSGDRTTKVLHNAKYDLHMFLRHGVQVQNVVFDTMIAMAILNENEPSLALKNIATKYGEFFGFQEESATYEELFGSGGFEHTPIDIGSIYACKDTHLTWELYMWQMEQFQRLPDLLELLLSIEITVLSVCVEMEQQGFHIDQDYAAMYQDQLQQEIQSLRNQLADWLKERNPDSPQQLQTYLYDELKLPDLSKKRSTEAGVLKALQQKHPSIPCLLAYREKKKLLSTYVESLPKLVAPDGRLHGQFNQVATVTGRFASRNPNLQNLPKEARKLIVAPEGKLMIGIDYSQIEPRVLAHLSGDQELQKPYLKGKDLYSTLASRVFHVPIEECGDGSHYRKMMKTGLLAVMYGTSMYTLAEQLGITVSEAEEFIADFFRAYPRVEQYIKTVHQQVEQQEYVTTMFGRKRRFPGANQLAGQARQLHKWIMKKLGHDYTNIWEESLPYKIKKQISQVQKEHERIKRQAVNSIIQGTATGDIMKKALIQVHKHCVTKGWKVIATVHDEILFEVDAMITLPEVNELERIMENVAQLNVPLKVDTAMMLRWGEEQTKAEWFGVGKS